MTTSPQPDPEALLAHSGYVRALARELVFDSAQAHDLEQETWLAALAQSPRDPAAQRGWLASIVRNLARRAWRSAGHRRAREEDHARLERHVPTPAEVLEQEDLRRTLIEALNALEEPYRAALVLRYLEGHEPREVARRMNVPLETAKTRLKRGLELLRARLDRASRGERSAWCLAFVRAFGLGPPSLAKLLGVALAASFTGTSGLLTLSMVKKAALASIVLASATTLFVFTRDAESSTGGARGGGKRVELSAEPAGSATPVSREAGASKLGREMVLATEPVVAQDPDVVTVEGRVLGPDGKPFAGAEVLLTRWHYDERYEKGPLALGRSDERGGFKLTYRKSDPQFKLEAERPEMWRHVTVSAYAAGLGPGWQSLVEQPQGVALEVKLVRDQPLTGRLLDLEGRPVAGVKVSVAGVAASDTGSLDTFLKDPAKSEPNKFLQFPAGKEIVGETDADGRFVLRGLGVERFTRIDLRGEQAAQTVLEVVTRHYEGPGEFLSGEVRRQLFGDGFEWVVRPTRPITGIVRDAKTGQPLADVTVGSQLMAGAMMVSDALKTRTGVDGRFRLVGMPKGAGNELLVIPNDEQPYFMAEVEVPDPAGMAPIELEVKLTRGLWITGRVTNLRTGEPVYGRLHYLPFLDNRAAQEVFGLTGGIPRVPGGFMAQDHYKTDAEGNFRLVGLPGPAILGVVTIGPYRKGAGAREIPELDENGQLPTFENPINASLQWPNSMRRIDPPAGATSIECNLEVDPGQVLEVQLADREGKPLEHCAVLGSAVLGSYGDALDAGPKVAIQSLGPGEQRLLRIHQPEKCLGLATKVSLENGPTELTLVPCTMVRGRLVDESGAPVGGVEVEMETGIDFDSVPSVRSDEAGRFRIEHVVPGVDFVIVARSEKLRDYFQRIAENPPLEGGVLDLGEVVVPLK